MIFILVGLIIKPSYTISLLLGFSMIRILIKRKYKTEKEVENEFKRLRAEKKKLDNLYFRDLNIYKESRLNEEDLIGIEKKLAIVSVDRIEMEINIRKEFFQSLIDVFKSIITPFQNTEFDSLRIKELNEYYDLDPILKSFDQFETLARNLFASYTIFENKIETRLSDHFKTIKDRYDVIVADKKEILKRIDTLKRRFKINKQEDNIQIEFEKIKKDIEIFNVLVLDRFNLYQSETDELFKSIFEDLENNKLSILSKGLSFQRSESFAHLSNSKGETKLEDTFANAKNAYTKFKYDVKNLFNEGQEKIIKQKNFNKIRVFLDYYGKEISTLHNTINRMENTYKPLLTDLDLFNLLKDEFDVIEKNILSFKSYFKLAENDNYESKTQVYRMIELFSSILDKIVELNDIDIPNCTRNIELSDIIQFYKQREMTDPNLFVNKRVTVMSNNIDEGKDFTLLNWINKLLKIFFKEWSSSKRYKERMIRKFEKKLNKKRAPQVGPISLIIFDIGESPMQMNGIRVIEYSDYEMVFDIDVSWQGYFQIVAETEIHIENKWVS